MTSDRHEATPTDTKRHRISGGMFPFLLGASLWLPGVLIVWLFRHRDSIHWPDGGARAAWIGCLLAPVFWTLVVLVGTVLVALAWWPIGELVAPLWG